MHDLNVSFLRSLPANSTLRAVFKAFPDLVRPLIVHHERLMRGPSALSVADRELIAAYASGGHHAGSACLDLHWSLKNGDSRSAFLNQLHAPLRAPVRFVLPHTKRLDRTIRSMA